jgi:carboxypeptidase C (cathepsin A)
MDNFDRRLRRAKSHLNNLNRQADKFLAGESYSTERDRDFKRGGYALKITTHKQIPPSFGLIASDFIHNLRALLDNLIWAAVPQR